MQKNLFLLILIILFISACSKEGTNLIQYPKTFSFHHSTITNEKGFVIGDHESYTEISSKAGNLDTLRKLYVMDFYGFVRNSGGAYLESFTVLSKDSIRLNLWNDQVIESQTIPAKINDPGGEPIDTVYFEGSTVKFDSIKQEFTLCLALSAAIVKPNGQVFGSFDGAFCKSNDFNTELKNILALHDYLKNDTLGVYLVDMVYR